MFTKGGNKHTAKYDLIPVHQAHKDVESGNALLVCAYESDEKFHNNALKAAISLNDFRQKENDLDKDVEILFYCN